MWTILTITRREISRVRQRFSGGASPLAVLFMLAAVAFTVFSLRNSLTPGSGLYRLGISGTAPYIQDPRFSNIFVSAEEGSHLLDKGDIDVLLLDDQVLSRKDEKSLYALQTLKSVLKKYEIERIGSTYTNERAYPLRVGINYLEPGGEAGRALNTGANQLAGQLPEEEIIIPSLTPPPAPFTQVLIALVYILPVTFISIFFTGSFMDEKINRRLMVLLSTPATPLQIILGKMLPYLLFALTAVICIALATQADVFLAVLIFIPAMLFIFAIYLMVPLFYRTFKDMTFISMLVTTVSTAALVFPAMFTGSSDLAYLSPLTLAVQMYRDEAFGWREYLFPSLPMLLIFCLALYAGTRLLNEEFLMTYRSITRKLLDAIYLLLNRSHPYISIFILSLLLVPLVYFIQIVIVIIASNLPPGVMLVMILIAAALVEETVKSVGIYTLIEKHKTGSVRSILFLSFLSALGFLISEKLLLLVSISAVSQLSLAGIILNNSELLLAPLAAHFIFTTFVTLLPAKTGLPYRYSLLLGTAIHVLYNWFLLGGMGI